MKFKGYFVVNIENPLPERFGKWKKEAVNLV
jgi:hypothetical protein